MGIGDAMSESAEILGVKGEVARERWEYKNFPEGEIDEMVEIYKKEHNFEEGEARAVLKAMTRLDLPEAEQAAYRELFIHHMCVQELGSLPPGDDDNPLMNGLVTFVSFLLFGFVPLLGYIIFYGAEYYYAPGQLGIVSAVTLVTLFGLGCLQAKIVEQSYLKQGMLMMVNGGAAAAASYLIGWGLQKALDVPSDCA